MISEIPGEGFVVFAVREIYDQMVAPSGLSDELMHGFET